MHTELLRVFKNEQFGNVRVIVKDNEPYFVGVDITKKLGYVGSSRDIRTHVFEEDITTVNIYDGKQSRNVLAINESGLYALILGSELPSAREFKKWLTSDVIPSLRRYGAYITDSTLEQIQGNTGALHTLIEALKDEAYKRASVEHRLIGVNDKVRLAEAITGAENTILVGDLAKILEQNGLDIGQNRLFEWLRGKGYLIKRTGDSYNMPSQKAMEQGLFNIKETVIAGKIVKTPKVTGKGQEYFINKLLNIKSEVL